MQGRTIVVIVSGCWSAHSWTIRSDSVLSRAYEKRATPRTGCSSVIGSGLSGNAPYATAEVVTSTCRMPASAAASSTLCVPFTSTSYMKPSSWDGFRMNARCTSTSGFAR